MNTQTAVPLVQSESGEKPEYPRRIEINHRVGISILQEDAFQLIASIYGKAAHALLQVEGSKKHKLTHTHTHTHTLTKLRNKPPGGPNVSRTLL